MKTITLILGLTTAALAQQPWPPTVWLHNELHIGTFQGAKLEEHWAEIRTKNTSDHAEAVILTARRYDGTLFQSARYVLSRGETRTVRVEDPGTSSTNGAQLLATILIDPFPPSLSVELTILALRGDQLLTAPLHTSRQELRDTGVFFPSLELKCCALSNTSDEPQTARYCGGHLSQKCDTASQAVYLPAFGTVEVPLLETTYLIFFDKPWGVLAACYQYTEGALSTFNVQSGITFGAPVEKKEKQP
jgi:hypothetical protein